MLAKTAGVKHLVVLINKMDDPTVLWDEGRYNECKEKLVPYLKRVGFNPNKDIMFMPCSGLTGFNLRDGVQSDVCSWYNGPAFIPYINDLPPLNRNISGESFYFSFTLLLHFFQASLLLFTFTIETFQASLFTFS